jgi:hypothetical protein
MLRLSFRISEAFSIIVDYLKIAFGIFLWAYGMTEA